MLRVFKHVGRHGGPGLGGCCFCDKSCNSGFVFCHSPGDVLFAILQAMCLTQATMTAASLPDRLRVRLLIRLKHASRGFMSYYDVFDQLDIVFQLSSWLSAPPVKLFPAYSRGAGPSFSRLPCTTQKIHSFFEAEQVQHMLTWGQSKSSLWRCKLMSETPTSSSPLRWSW